MWMPVSGSPDNAALGLRAYRPFSESPTTRTECIDGSFHARTPLGQALHASPLSMQQQDRFLVHALKESRLPKRSPAKRRLSRSRMQADRWVGFLHRETPLKDWLQR